MRIQNWVMAATSYLVMASSSYGATTCVSIIGRDPYKGVLVKNVCGDGVRFRFVCSDGSGGESFAGACSEDWHPSVAYCADDHKGGNFKITGVISPSSERTCTDLPKPDLKAKTQAELDKALAAARQKAKEATEKARSAAEKNRLKAIETEKEEVERSRQHAFFAV